MSENSSSSSSGVIGLLGVVFVALKLCGVINWSWWWITAPFWGCALVWMLALMVIVVIAAGR